MNGLQLASITISLSPIEVIAAGAASLAAFVYYRFDKFIRKWIGHLLESVFWNGNRFFRRKLASQISLKRYCRLELGAEASKYLDVPGAATALKTDTAYVPLVLEDGEGEQRSFSHETMLQAGPRLCVIGDPGSGKSSLLKRVHRDTCGTAFMSVSGRRLPVRIELKRFAPPRGLDQEAELGRWALGCIRDKVAEAEVFEMAECFDSYASDRGLLLLLDGLDEVPADSYPSTIAAIRGLSVLLERMSDRNVVILTMRTQFHRQVAHDLAETFPLTLRICAFTPNDIFRFLTKWPFGSRAAAEVNRIYVHLSDRPTLREMCTNPLVLAMYVARDQQIAHESELPETRTSFYRQVVSELMIARRGRQVGMPPVRTALSRQREAILGRMALSHLLDLDQPANSLSWDSSVDIACEVLKQEDRAAAEAYLRRLSSETGLVAEERPGESLCFIHLTFCEFFAALEAAEGEENGVERVLAAHRSFRDSDTPQLRTRLAEVVPFAIGMLPRRRAAGLLVAVVESGDAQTVTRCFLETQQYESDLWPEFVQTEAQRLAGHDLQDWNEAWLSRLHLLGVVLREAELWASMTPGAQPVVSEESLFSTLVRGNEERLVRVFSSYAARDPGGSLRLAEACGVNLAVSRPDLMVEACTEPPFVSLIAERLARETAQHEIWAPILAEAGLRSEVAATLLQSTPPIAAWREAVEDQRVASQWPAHEIATPSAYRDSLALACKLESRKGPVTAYPLVRCMASAGAPPSRSRERALTAIMAIGFAAVAAMLLLSLILNHGKDKGLANILFVLGIVLGIALSVYMGPHRSLRRHILCDLLDLVSDPDRMPSTNAERRNATPEMRRIGDSAEQVLTSRTKWLTLHMMRRHVHAVRFMGGLRTAVGRAARELQLYEVQRDDPEELVMRRTDGRFEARLEWSSGGIAFTSEGHQPAHAEQGASLKR